MKLAELSITSAAVAATTKKTVKTAALAELLRRVPPGERAIAARYLAGDIGHKTGIGYQSVYELRDTTAARDPTLELTELDRRFAAISELAGSGSQTARKQALGAIFALATRPEQELLSGILTGGLRQGALDALVIDAVAAASGAPASAVRRAVMLAGDLGPVAEAVLADPAATARFGLTLFRPVLPMLAHTADSASHALVELAGEAAFELKLDGFRVQIHKDGDVVRAYSRLLNDVTASVPDVIARVAGLPARRLIVDGEAIGYGDDGRPLPFQDTMRRPGGLALSLFDVLLVDDDTLLGTPARDRFGVLTEQAPRLAVPRVITADPAEATTFYERAIADGHEGVMAKALDAPYDAGKRGAAWLKIKKIYRLDLVVIAVEWGSGRRKGWLSNLHLGARDPASGEFVMLGKTFKGMTDEMLAWQTAELLAREVDRDGHIVFVRPELVAEIAFNDVQRSRQYPGGVTLRHARVVRYRTDKTAAEADTIDAVRAIAVRDGVMKAPSRGP